LRGGCRLSDQLNLTLALENIGDENYRVHGSGLNEPGRNAIIALEGRW
ncbi:MAG: hemoglobin/transferrin/lactoferrin receptor protein, partial [Verrucomicrobiales bacterium]